MGQWAVRAFIPLGSNVEHIQQYMTKPDLTKIWKWSQHAFRKCAVRKNWMGQ